MLKNWQLHYYRKFRDSGMLASDAKRSALILDEFQDLQDDGKVWLDAIPEEENYFDVFGEPETKKQKEYLRHFLETWGCWTVKTGTFCSSCGHKGHSVDSIGMCVYKNPIDPFENWYVVDLMQSAIDAVK